MRPINLIPAEDRRGERAPLRAGPLSYIVVGVLLLGFLSVYMLVSTGNAISERTAVVASFEQQLQSTQARAAALQSFSNFASLEEARTETVGSLARSRFDWERVIRELAFVIPGDISLISLSGSVGASAAATSGGDASSEGIDAPTLTMSGCGTNHESVAGFVAALRDIDGVTRVGLENSQKGSTGATSSAPTVTSATGGGGGCVKPGAASFSLTAAFDEVAVDAAEGEVAPPTALAEPAAGDGSGVGEAAQESGAAKDSVESGQGRAREAVDRYIPGT